MDVVSAIASIIALAQLADRIVDLSSTYIGHAKGAEKEISQIITTIAGLKGFLVFLEKFVESADAARISALLSQCEPNGPLDLCTDLMEDIESKLKGKKVGMGKALVWPFQRKDIVESLEFVEKYKSSLSLALQGDTLQGTLTIEPAVKDIQRHVHTQAEKDVLKWLNKVDPFTNHWAARTKWEPGTGGWFVSSHEFTAWMLPGRSLWLYGIPGGGKTVLCWTIIESLKDRLGRFPLCFYFDFRDPQRQSVVNMLYSLLAQLSEDKVPADVQRLYESCAHGNRDASVSQLKETFLSITKRIASEQHTTYLVIDALDECGDRETLMSVITEMCESTLISILATSRQEQDISSALKGIVTYAIPIQTDGVNDDINTHIQMCLENDTKLSKWDDGTKRVVADHLKSKANGMFRWIECQLDILRRCYKKRDLLRALDSLPKTLESTYERILLQEYVDDAAVIFKVLSCAFRPILLGEAADIIAVDLVSISFNSQDRPNDPSAILGICSTLLSAANPPRDVVRHIQSSVDSYLLFDYNFRGFDPQHLPSPGIPMSLRYDLYSYITPAFALLRPQAVRELSFAHLSVKEYLESDGAPPSFRITPEDANATMARLGLAFLVSTELSLPFVMYASDYWLLHAQKSGQQSYFDLENLVQQFLEAPNASRLRIWMQYTNTLSKRAIVRHRATGYPQFDSTKWEVSSEDRLFYASFLGFPSICRAFIANGANVNAVVEKKFRSALTGACLGGHKAIVKLLLDHGANPDPIRKIYVTPLWAACSRRDVEIVRLLLTEIVDRTSNTLALTLLAAAKFGAVEIVELLLERGVEVNTVENYGHWGSYFVNFENCSPLRAPITGGDEQVVRILLKHGADVHLGGYRSPLEEAVDKGPLRFVQILLDNGADLKQCRSNVLGIAVLYHSRAEHLLSLLLSHVSKVDVESGYYDQAFEMARHLCSKSVLRLFEAAGFENRGN